MALEQTGTPMVDTRGKKTASIQDKVVNLLHNDKVNYKTQEYLMGFVLTGECHFLHGEIKDIFKQEQIKTLNASQSLKDYFRC